MPNASAAVTYTPAESINGLLSTDVALIGANDTHVALSLRISRRWLADNHHVLLMLSNIASGAD
jgi:hypothetical protein